MGAGGLLGAMAAMTLGARRLAVVFGARPRLLGAADRADGCRARTSRTAIVLLAVIGAANSVEDVAVVTLLQRTVPDDVLTRVFGVFWGLAMGAVALGSIAAPVVVDVVGSRTAFLVVGSILPLLTLATYRRLVEIDQAVAPGPELGLIERVPMFAPLSLAAKERIARNLVPVTVTPGELVIRAGDIGDRFYLVADGELDIDVDGLHVAARQGDYFGEIALLRDVPRTATVTATADSRLYALERDAFLEVVTGQAAALAAGQDVAAARLARAGSDTPT